MYWAGAMLARLHGCLLLLVCLLCSGRAHAYAWMIRHGYTQCVQCHVDPSGAGALTPYGRAMGELVLRTRYPFDKPDDPGMALRLASGDHEFARIGGDLRVLSLHSKVDRVKLRHDLIWMQIDLDATVEQGPVV